jgi:hypothetical protein
MKIIKIMGAVAAIAMAASWAGCGSGSSSDGGNGSGMSESEAVALSEQLSGVATNAMNNISAQVIKGLEAETFKDVQCNPDTRTCTYYLPFSWRQNCTAGGRIEVSGSLEGTTTDGSGYLSMSAQETITDWQCIGNYIINGDPYISLTGTFTWMNDQPATQQTMSINGGFKWGTTAEESCQIHLAINFSANGSGTITGTVCGYTVNASF